MREIIFVCFLAMVFTPKYGVAEVDTNLKYNQYEAYGPTRHWNRGPTSAYLSDLELSLAALNPEERGSIIGAPFVGAVLLDAMRERLNGEVVK